MHLPFLTLPTLRATRLLALGLLATVAPLTATRAAEPTGEFFFKDGDRAMILGDSITQGRTYSTYVETYVVSRFPNWKITFRNTGWSGDTMGLRTRGGLDKGFDRDLKPLAPTAVTIDFGMNDGRGGAGRVDAYVDSANTLADKFAALGTRVAFVTSSPEERYQEGQPAGSAYNKTLRLYSDRLRTVAEERKLPFVDQLAPMINVIEEGRRAGVLATREGGARLVGDAVHPGPEGGLVMATAILKGLNAPTLVSAVEINAATGAVKANRAEVSAVQTGETLTFTRLDASMPWPVPAEIGNVLKVPGFTPFDDLSFYGLKVTGLTAANYKVAADGRTLAHCTKEQLAAGVNLSSEARRALPEVKALLDAVTAKNDLFFKRWRGVQLADLPDWVPLEPIESARQQRLKELDEQLAKADAALDALRQPKPHVWTLTPTP